MQLEITKVVLDQEDRQLTKFSLSGNLYKKTWEFNKEMHILLVDFQKAYDSIQLY